MREARRAVRQYTTDGTPLPQGGYEGSRYLSSESMSSSVWPGCQSRTLFGAPGEYRSFALRRCRRPQPTWTGCTLRRSRTPPRHRAEVSAQDQRNWRQSSSGSARMTSRPPGNPECLASCGLRLGCAVWRCWRGLTVLAPHVARTPAGPRGCRAGSRGPPTGWRGCCSPPSRKARVRSQGIRDSARGWGTPQAVESLQRLLGGLGQVQQAATEPDTAVAGQWRSEFLVVCWPCLSSSWQPRAQPRSGTSSAAAWQQDFPSDLLESDSVHRAEYAHALSLQLRATRSSARKFAVAAGRGLLGDDMGLGKTVQALAAIAHADRCRWPAAPPRSLPASPDSIPGSRKSGGH